MKMKVFRLSFCIALALHYLCTLKMSCPNKDNPECLVNLVKNKIYDK